MIKVIGVRFRTAGKIYFFDPLGFEIKRGDAVIVETARGIEYGTVMSGIREVEDEKVVQPLKPVLRLATDRDKEQAKNNQVKEREAFKTCQEKIREHNLDMKLIDAEYTFDNNKILFYFTADGRIDFRELVKDLAGIFKTRIELRQIGVRDETKLLGGIGICGRPLCCHTYLSDFVPVSIKMAKEQNLSLNPTKISGVCGRLMCCLKNEEETYEELNRKLPNVGDFVTTADGQKGEVSSVNVLRQLVKVVVSEGDNKEIKEYPVDDLTFRKRHGKRGGEDVSAEEMKELEKLEKEEKDSKKEEKDSKKEDRRDNRDSKKDSRKDEKKKDGEAEGSRDKKSHGKGNQGRDQRRPNRDKGQNRGKDNQSETSVGEKPVQSEEKATEGKEQGGENKPHRGNRNRRYRGNRPRNNGQEGQASQNGSQSKE